MDHDACSSISPVDHVNFLEHYRLLAYEFLMCNQVHVSAFVASFTLHFFFFLSVVENKMFVMEHRKTSPALMRIQNQTTRAAPKEARPARERR